MQVDFYQLSRDPAESALAMIADKALETGARLLVVSADEAQLGRISEALWLRKDSFLAHGAAGGPDDARQPILLSDTAEPANAARFVAFADGRWRDEGLNFERVFLLFDGATLDDARATWRRLDGEEGLVRNYWRQDEGKWVKAG